MDRRWFVGAALAATGSLATRALAEVATGGELRIGLTAVVVREYARFFMDLQSYLSVRTGRAVSFVQRRTYADIMRMLGRQELEAAWICGYPYVQRRNPEFLRLLVAPVYQGAPLYRSYVIASASSSARGIEDFRDRVFAYSDPDSNSGYLVPRVALLDAGYDPETFFRFTFFTYNHAETVTAVADGVADGGAVDSYVYNVVARYEPELARRTRVVSASRQFGFPPIVVHRALEAEVAGRLRNTLIGMADEPAGRALLRRLGLDGFQEVSPSLYDSIRDLAARARTIGRPVDTL